METIKKAVYRRLLTLDGPVLKSDGRITKQLKRTVLKPIGFYFRRKYYTLIIK